MTTLRGSLRLVGVTQTRNTGGSIGDMRHWGMAEYVKGPEPDRWHWIRSCGQYPRVVFRRRLNRPNADLCDDCLDLEKLALRKAAAV